MKILFLLFLHGAFVHHLAIDLEETCPQGQAAATKCQIKIRDAFHAASDPATTIAEGLLLFCCNLAYGIDCIIHNAIPLCEKSEREELTKAANDYFITIPEEQWQASCEEAYFVDRKVPDVCHDIVHAPNFNETVPTPDDSPYRSRTPITAILLAVFGAVVLTTVVMALPAAVQYHRNGSSNKR